ncbi:MAG: DUF927 domain-containing protein [Chromatiales bacterium]|nr:DUF927 domain-containing protein [Chromatiales bacterium]
MPVDQTPPRIDEPPPVDEIPPLDDEAAPDEPKAPLPWAGKSPPKGWKLTRNAVFEIKEKRGDTRMNTSPPVARCGWSVAPTGAHGRVGIGARVSRPRWPRAASRHACRARLHAGPVRPGRRSVATWGCKPTPRPGRRRSLAYLAAWDVDERILSAKRLGWLEDPTGALAFVMPDHVIGRDGNRELVYQPDRYSPTVKTVHGSGSLEHWRDRIARPAGEHPPMLFALCAGLAPALLAFAEGADSYVLHFWGTTSRGKTTLAQLGRVSVGLRGRSGRRAIAGLHPPVEPDRERLGRSGRGAFRPAPRPGRAWSRHRGRYSARWSISWREAKGRPR